MSWRTINEDTTGKSLGQALKRLGLSLFSSVILISSCFPQLHYFVFYRVHLDSVETSVIFLLPRIFEFDARLNFGRGEISFTLLSASVRGFTDCRSAKKQRGHLGYCARANPVLCLVTGVVS